MHRHGFYKLRCKAPANTCSSPCNTSKPCTGTALNAFYGYSDYTMGYCAGILIVYIVGCKLF
jgi:hypothetical protein